MQHVIKEEAYSFVCKIFSDIFDIRNIFLFGEDKNCSTYDRGYGKILL